MPDELTPVIPRLQRLHPGGVTLQHASQSEIHDEDDRKPEKRSHTLTVRMPVAIRIKVESLTPRVGLL